MVRQIPPKVLQTGSPGTREPSMITRLKFPTHINNEIWGRGVTPRRTPSATATRRVMLTKDAKLSLHAILFPAPVPVGAIVQVIDKEFHDLGDVNWDGVIEEADARLVADAFGAVPGDPNWNPDYDLNNDGVIDITDVSHVALNIGKTAPEYKTSVEVDVPAGKCVVKATSADQVLEKTLTAKSGETLTLIFVYDIPLGTFSQVVTPPTPPIGEMPLAIPVT